jgi:hypothetical protein
MLLPSGPANTRCSVCRFEPGGLHVQLSPAPGTGLQSPETGSQNRRYRDLSRRQRPQVPHSDSVLTPPTPSAQPLQEPDEPTGVGAMGQEKNHEETIAIGCCRRIVCKLWRGVRAKSDIPRPDERADNIAEHTPGQTGYRDRPRGCHGHAGCAHTADNGTSPKRIQENGC